MKTILPFALLGLIAAGCSDGSGNDPEPSRDKVEPVAVDAAADSQETPPQIENVPSDTADAVASDVRSVEAHVHGDATLAIVQEDHLLLVELETPLYNLLGFEHDPENDEQRAVVAEAKARLASPQTLIGFDPSAGCRANAMEADAVTLFEDEAVHDHDDHVHEPDDDHDHHDDADHDDANHSEDHGDHSDVLFQYSFTCDQPDRLSRISTTLFEAFPRMSAIDGVYLGKAVQSSFTLSPRRPEADMGR